MQLIINTYGAYLYVKDDLFEIRVDGEKKQVSPKKVRSILITTGAALSSDAVKLAVEHNIDILFLNKYGKPFGRVWHDKLGSTARIRREQLKLSETEEGTKIGKNFIIQKFENQIRFLEELRDRRTRLSAEITSVRDTIKNALSAMKNVGGKPPMTYAVRSWASKAAPEGPIGKPLVCVCRNDIVLTVEAGIRRKTNLIVF